jgi:hypothetical protein
MSQILEIINDSCIATKLIIKKDQLDSQEINFEIKKLTKFDLKKLPQKGVYSSLITDKKNHVKVVDEKDVTFYFKQKEEVFISMSCLKSSLELIFFCETPYTCFQYKLVMVYKTHEKIIAFTTLHACQF